MLLDQKDLSFLSERGITPEMLEWQENCLRNGVPFLRIASAAVPGSGIFRIPQDRTDQYIDSWYTYSQTEKSVLKFVPASGAASRMFKDLYAFLNAGYDEPQTPQEKCFFDGLSSFAFFESLDSACLCLYGKGALQLVGEGFHKQVVRALLTEKGGLEYGNLAKGLLLFHGKGAFARTPVEEHMAEGALYAANRNGKVRIHFTVSPKSEEAFRRTTQANSLTSSRRYGVDYEISFSFQKPSTDTVSLDMDGNLVRTQDGLPMLRPSGHGALISNLNSLDGDVIFVKNIDNVVPDRLKGESILYKKLLAGYLVSLQQRLFSCLKLLDTGKCTRPMLMDMCRFLETELCCMNPQVDGMEDSALAAYLRSKLNRPVRVCGMVPRSGESGGGPFLVYGSDGTVNPQILESSQLDETDSASIAIVSGSTHFNPVDLVLGVRDYRGEKFDLTRYVDHSACFVSEKTYQGRPIRVLELPGLWNGGMSDWNTVFVEVPLSTFNPVKSVNDLLRPQHQ